MTSKWRWYLLQFSRRLGVRASLFSVLAVAAALVGTWVEDWVPKEFADRIGANALDALLQVISASMLSVTIFSLSTMVTAYATATSNVTPRATRLLSQDVTAHNALATFVGAFLFSLVGIVALQTGLYGEQGRVVLYLATIGVLVVIVVTLLRWIEYVSTLGRVGETTERIEHAAASTLKAWHRRPHLGGMPLAGQEAPRQSCWIRAKQHGYVQHIDMEALQKVSERIEQPIRVHALPGDYSDHSHPLAWVENELDAKDDDAIRQAFSVDDERSFDQDPRFGIVVLAEIATRALSPGINDPGTAIDVLGRGARLLMLWSEPAEESAADRLQFPGVHVPAVELRDLFDDLFSPIARDGAHLIEVGIRLQKALRSLGQCPQSRYADAARAHSKLALERAEAALRLDSDKQRLRELAEQVCADSND